MSAVQGQSSRLSVILRGTQSSRLVQCFSSHPEELQVIQVFNFFFRLGRKKRDLNYFRRLAK